MDKAPECEFKCQGYVMDFCCGEFCERLVKQKAGTTAKPSVTRGPIYETYNPEHSCDTCASQDEGRHYCLLRGEPVKNMNMMICHDFTHYMNQESDPYYGGSGE